VKVEVIKRLAFAATAIEFETGKANIKKKSYPLLDEIVGILNDYPDYMMTIDGYTDNAGKSAMNLELSKKRAASVEAYFISKGIPDARIETDGHGDTDPVASNKTAKGRAKNRRVEMNLKLK
jgi:outer membrane protein OmpA-like peptidoglycan-associated protein